MPIATAPKDGTSILISALSFYCGITVVYWDDDYSNWTVSDGRAADHYLGAEPLFWQPLPEPPLDRLRGSEDESNV